jgi:hypothetical protein
MQNNEESTFPKITGVSKGSDTTLVFAGEAFYTAGYEVTAEYKSI